jgi:hypothetical protein
MSMSVRSATMEPPCSGWCFCVEGRELEAPHLRLATALGHAMAGVYDESAPSSPAKPTCLPPPPPPRRVRGKRPREPSQPPQWRTLAGSSASGQYSDECGADWPADRPDDLRAAKRADAECVDWPAERPDEWQAATRVDAGWVD